MAHGVQDGEDDRPVIQRIIRYLNDQENSDGVWRGLLFMEANNIDFSLRSEQLHGYLIDEESSPIENPRQISFEEERRIVLALREVARNALGLPPLSDAEKSNWKYDIGVAAPPYTNVSTDIYHKSDTELREIRQFVKESDPEFLNAVRIFFLDSLDLDGERNKGHSTTWAYFRLARLIRVARPKFSPADVHQVALDILEELRGETRRQNGVSNQDQ